MKFQNTLQFAQELDRQDPLHDFRNEFILPQRNETEAIYFLGNSLGLQPKNTAAYTAQIFDQWKNWGVEGFFLGEQPWIGYHDQLVGPLAKIVGCLPHEVVVMNSLTVNLHLMLVSFYQPEGKRKKILCEAKAFCSDQYMLETHVRQRGFDPEEIIIEVQPRENEFTIAEEDIISAIGRYGDELALIFLGGVNYYTGQVLDMERIASAAQSSHIRIGFDLAHAAGNILLQLHEWNVDFACWCSYKYLNSGPGAIGGAFIHEKYHDDSSLNRFAGWWGYNKETRFKMQKGFVPIHSAEGWQLSTPSPVLYAAHKASLELFEAAGMKALEAKGQQLSDFLLFLLHQLNNTSAHEMVRIITPASSKGCQVSMLMMKKGKEMFDALTDAHVFADWREPDVIRIAPVPFYNTFEEVWRFVHILENACKKLYNHS